MADSEDIDFVLRDWPFQPGVISARLVQARDGREVMQMRVEMGVLQMETAGRPDGERPSGHETYLDYLLSLELLQTEEILLDDEKCTEIDREILQFYHRRICSLALREFRRAITDADHTLALMDLISKHTSEAQWALSHEKYRPFVLFHRTQAAALAELQELKPEAAVEQIGEGLEKIRDIYKKLESESQFDQDELVNQLYQLQDSLRQEYGVGKTLIEQLADAIASEEYERAASLRDQIAKRQSKKP